MTGLVLTNNAVSRLASSLSTGATTLSVDSGTGAKFPALTAGQWFPCTLLKSDGSLEVVRVTGRSSDVLTITRAQEGTAALAFSAGDRVELRLTAGAVSDIIALFGDYLRKDENLAGITSAATARGNLGLGTAAILTATTTTADPTTGRAQRSGDYGVGGPAIAITSSALDSSDRPSGFYFVDASTQNSAPVAVNGYLMHIDIASAGFAYQRYATVTGSRKFERTQSGGVWSAWTETWHTGNFDPNSKQNALGYTPVQQGTGAGQLTNAVKLGWDGTKVTMFVDVTSFGGIHTDTTFLKPSNGVNWVSVGGTGYALPAGGTWAYFFFNTSGSGVTASSAGVAAGGTSLGTTNAMGFAWRIQ